MILRHVGGVGDLIEQFGFVDGLRLAIDLVRRSPHLRFIDQRRSYVMPNDRSARHHLVESIPKLRRLAEYVKDSDTVIVDVGAHAGLFAAFALDMAPRTTVLCAEPDPLLHRYIRANARGRDAIQIIPAAVVDQSGTISFYRSRRSTQTSSIHRAAVEAFQPDAEQIEVVAMSLDDMCRDLGHIDVLKVDVQGAESHVIAGASETLAKTRTVLIEVTFLDPDPVQVLTTLTQEFGPPDVVNVVVSGADLVFERR